MTAAQILALPAQTSPKLILASDDAKHYFIAAGQSGADAKVFVSSASDLTSGTVPIARLVATQTVGDADATIAALTRDVLLTAVLTAPRVYTLPAASGYPAGARVSFSDITNTLTAVNTATLARAGADTINGATSIVLNTAGASPILISDGTSKWNLDIRGVSRGGTGATTAAAARTNLQINNTTNLDAQYATPDATRLECDFGMYAHGTEIVRGTTLPKVGNAWRWNSAPADIAPVVVAGGIQGRPGVIHYFGNDVGAPIRSISFECEYIGTNGTDSRAGMTFAFHSTEVLNPSTGGIPLPAGMLHITTNFQGVGVGYSIASDANFYEIAEQNEAYNGTPTWSPNNGASGGSWQFGKKFIITFEFSGDEMRIIAMGRTRVYKHSAIAAAAPRHWFYEFGGNNPAGSGEFFRLYGVWANSPKIDRLKASSAAEVVGDLQTAGPLFLPNRLGMRYGIDGDFGQTLTLTGNAVDGETVTIGGQYQVKTMAIRTAATSTGTGSATATVAGVNYPVTFSITNGNSASTIATAVRAAFNAVTAITDLYTVGGTGGTVLFTRKTRAAHDDTLHMDFPTQFGSIATYSETTTKGIASNVYTWRDTLAASGDVKIGATSTDSRNNLVTAINRSHTGSGTQYHASTPLNGSAYAIYGTTGVSAIVVPFRKRLTLVVSETMTAGAFAATSTWKNGNPVSSSDGKHLFNGDVGISGKLYVTPATGLTGPLFGVLNDDTLTAAVASNGTTDQTLKTLVSNTAMVAGSSEKWEIYGTFAANANTKQFKVTIVGATVLDFGALSPDVAGEPFVLTITRFYMGAAATEPYRLFGKLETNTLNKVISGNKTGTYSNGFTYFNLVCTTTAANDIVLTGLQKINCIR